MQEVVKEEITQGEEEPMLAATTTTHADKEKDSTTVTEGAKPGEGVGEPVPTSSSLLMEMSIIATIAGLFIGTGNITSFPMNAIEYGGLYYLLCHILLVSFLGLPIVFFEILIGQITGKETLVVYGTYCKAAKGIGVTLFMVSIVLICFYVNMDSDSPGIDVQMMINAFSSHDIDILSCDNHWNTKQCSSLYNSVRNCSLYGEPDQQFMLTREGGCTNETTGGIFKDTLIELSDYCDSAGGFDYYHLVTTSFILLAPLLLLLVDIKYTFYCFGLIFLVYFILYLIILTLVASMIDDYGNAINFIWHRTILKNLLSPKALNALVSGVMWSLSLNGFMAPIGSFLKQKDRSFRIIATPVLLDLTVSVLSVGMIAGALSRLQKLSPASDYLYTPAFENGQGLIMYSQLIVTYLDNFKWVAMFSLCKLLGLITKLSYPVICFKSIFRDHLQGVLSHRIVYVGGYVAFNLAITVASSYAPSFDFMKGYYTVSLENVCKRLLYFAGIQICISVYGEVDFRIDVGQVYDDREDWRRFFSPIGPVMFFCWKQLIPAILLMSQTFVFLESMSAFRSSPISAILPVAMVLMAPLWAIGCIIKQIINREPIFDVFGPSADHPSYQRIHDLKKKK